MAQLTLDTLDVVEQLAEQTASHMHSNTSTPPEFGGDKEHRKPGGQPLQEIFTRHRQITPTVCNYGLLKIIFSSGDNPRLYLKEDTSLHPIYRSMRGAGGKKKGTGKLKKLHTIILVIHTVFFLETNS